MASADFFFVLECAGPGAPVDLIGEVVSQVLVHAGSSSEKVPELAPAMRQAASAGQGAVPTFEVAVGAHGGTLDVAVSSDGKRVWQTSQPIP